MSSTMKLPVAHDFLDNCLMQPSVHKIHTAWILMNTWDAAIHRSCTMQELCRSFQCQLTVMSKTWVLGIVGRVGEPSLLKSSGLGSPTSAGFLRPKSTLVLSSATQLNWLDLTRLTGVLWSTHSYIALCNNRTLGGVSVCVQTNQCSVKPIQPSMTMLGVGYSLWYCRPALSHDRAPSVLYLYILYIAQLFYHIEHYYDNILLQYETHIYITDTMRIPMVCHDKTINFYCMSLLWIPVHIQ